MTDVACVPREPYVSSPRLALKDEDIISLRTAGDISVPREVSKTAHTHWPGGGSHYAFRSPTHAPRGGPTHTHWAEPIYQSGRCVATYAQPVYDNVRSAGVLATERAGQLRVGRREPEYHNVEALRPGGGRRGRRPLLRESGGDYASDVHSVTSRLSNVSVETNRSDPTDLRLSKYTVSHSSSSPARARSPGEQASRPAQADEHRRVAARNRPIWVESAAANGLTGCRREIQLYLT